MCVCHKLYIVINSSIPYQTRNVEPMLVQCWSTVYDAGPTMNQHRLNVSLLVLQPVFFISYILCHCLPGRSRSSYGYSSMFRRSYVQKVLCSEGPMFRRFYVQKVLCSEGSKFRRFYVQKVLYSESSMFRRSYVQKCLFRRSYV